MRENARQLQEVHDTHGFVRVMVLLVQFPDHVERSLPPVVEYEELFNGEVASDIIPTGSVAKYIEDNSYGAFRIEAEVMDWVVTDMTEEEYSFGESGVTVEFGQAMYPALDHLERQGFDFSRFDLNDDGMIDSIVLLHSGYAAEIGGVDCESGADVTNRIWSHAITNRDVNWKSKTSGIRTNSYCVSSGLQGRCGADVARLSVITHEFLHTLGLPDLTDSSGDAQGRGAGDFDIMSNAHGRDGNQIYPASLSPWSKMELGWIEPKEILSNGTFVIKASETAPNLYIIRHNFPTGESLVIENRQPLMWDRLLWNGGLLIWHFDDTQRLISNRGYPGQPGWPGNGNHYGLAVLSADGNYDLEMGNNSGNDGDFWRDGARLGPGPVEDDASDTGIYPNTNSYQWGRIQKTGIIIDQISDTSIYMSFRVRGLPQPDPVSPTMMAADNPISPQSIPPVITVPANNYPSSEPSHRPVMMGFTTETPISETSIPPFLWTFPIDNPTSETRTPSVIVDFTIEIPIPETSTPSVLVGLATDSPNPDASLSPIMQPIQEPATVPTIHQLPLQTPAPSLMPLAFTTGLSLPPSLFSSSESPIPTPQPGPTTGPLSLDTPGSAQGISYSPSAIRWDGFTPNFNVFDRPIPSVGAGMLKPHQSNETATLQAISGAHHVAASLYVTSLILWLASLGW